MQAKNVSSGDFMKIYCIFVDLAMRNSNFRVLYTRFLAKFEKHAQWFLITPKTLFLSQPWLNYSSDDICDHVLVKMVAFS